MQGKPEKNSATVEEERDDSLRNTLTFRTPACPRETAEYERIPEEDTTGAQWTMRKICEHGNNNDGTIYIFFNKNL